LIHKQHLLTTGKSNTAVTLQKLIKFIT